MADIKIDGVCLSKDTLLRMRDDLSSYLKDLIKDLSNRDVVIVVSDVSAQIVRIDESIEELGEDRESHLDNDDPLELKDFEP